MGSPSGRRGAAPADRAARPPRRSRWPDGAVRRLRDAGPLSRRRRGRAPARAARRALFDVSHMGIVGLHGAGRGAGARSGWCPSTVSGLGVRPHALHGADHRGRWRHRRRHGRQRRRRSPDPRSSTPAARRPTWPTCGPASPPRWTSSTAPTSPCWRCRGRGRGGAVAVPPRPGGPELVFMRRTGTAVAGDTGRHQPLRLHRRGRLRDHRRRRAGPRAGPGAAGGAGRWRSPGRPPGTRCGSRPGSASTATTSTARPAPIEAGLAPGPSRPAAGRRAASPARRRILGQLRDGPVAGSGSACAPRAASRCGTAPPSTRDGAPAGTVTSGGYGPTAGGPVALALVDPSAAAPGTSSWPTCGARRAVPRGRGSPSSPIATPVERDPGARLSPTATSAPTFAAEVGTAIAAAEIAEMLATAQRPSTSSSARPCPTAIRHGRAARLPPARPRPR